MAPAQPKKVPLFNSRFETGVRAVFVLRAVYPRALDLERLVNADHFVVHTADLGGPESLHPATSTRATEMLVRRELVYDGLMLMQSCLLVRRIASEKGLTYQAGNDAAIFIGALRTEYFDALRRSAIFLAEVLAQLTEQEFDALVDRQLERWAIQFQDVTGPLQ